LVEVPEIILNSWEYWHTDRSRGDKKPWRQSVGV